MTSPFLPIFTNSQAVALENTGSGKTGSAIEPSGQGDGQVTFSDVLDGTQQVVQENEQSSLVPFESQPLVFEAILNDQEILDELASHGLILTEHHGTFSFQFKTAASTSGQPLQQSLEVFQSYKATPVNTPIQGVDHAVIAQAQALLNRLNGPGVIATPVRSTLQGNAVHRIAEPRSDLSIPIQNLTRLNENTGAVSQAVDGEELREQPLLHKRSQPFLDTRPSSVSAVTVLTDPPLNAQRLLPTFEGLSVNPQTIVETLAGGTRLPASQDELTQGLARVESENKLIGGLGASQGMESHSGHSGTGLPFGHHAGTGQGQLFDSTSSNLTPTSQGQIVAKSGNFDERLQLLNTSVPHRLQIDVQVSESSRVQVDVGVAQRHVYAGVLLDNPVLRALASQNVQNLETQLGQADMELEEFDVHEERPHLHEQSEHKDFSGHGQRKGFMEQAGDTAGPREGRHSQTVIPQDRGWHLVA
ncbi:MAG: hypothetical protein NPIRA05_19520 [Nitrospirales bacterium]|nr:MAG: hypothetical protein NPIRA05_19520 [Nitrospirales bacterium]